MCQRLRIGIGKILACALSVLMLAQGSHAKAATLLSPAPAFNGRVMRLEHAPRPEDRHWLVATALVPAAGKHANAYLADRDNAPFRQIGEISDPAFGSGVCCGTLYELPQQVGSLQAGTLLWAASVGKKTERMATRIYRSNDEGRSWSYLSEIRAAKPGGIWEPEFTVGSDGAPILFFSDETDRGGTFADHQEGENLRRTSVARHGLRGRQRHPARPPRHGRDPAPRGRTLDDDLRTGRTSALHRLLPAVGRRLGLG